MAGNANFESSTVSPENSGFLGNYSNGQWSNYTGPSLNRSGSFRERSDGRSFSSGPGTLKIGTSTMADMLQLEPIAMGNLKKIRPGELRRALGFGFVNMCEDNTFGASHSKPPPTLATDEIKRFRTGVYEGMLKARNRMKRLDESLNKLNKYIEVLNSKKQLPNERSGNSNLLKMGNQAHRNSPDIVNQKLEDKNKSPVLNKRARTPLGDMRAEGRSNGVPRQRLMLGKDEEGAKESSSNIGDERTRRLPVGGEGWDKKMKRKRSVSSVFPRPVDGDGELKRTLHGRLGNDSGVHPSDAHGFRSGSINGATTSNKIEGAQSPSGLSTRVTPKNEQDNTSLSREITGMNKEKLLQKGNSKLSNREDSYGFNPGSIMKGKATRANRHGPTPTGNSSPSLSRVSEEWEQPVTPNKVHSLNGVHRKRPLPSDSSSPPMAQWVGQRPQKISRNRRTNIISPTSNHNEVQLSSQGCPPDFSARNLSGVLNGSFLVRNIMSSSQQLKEKLDNAPSPIRLSESEENSGVDIRDKDKGLCSSELEGKSFSVTRKGKLLGKDEIGDGIRRQGRSGRGTLFQKRREKLEIPSMVKPVGTARPVPEKNGSKLGRPPLKKHSDRKGFTCLGPGANSSSPDLNGESDDDREELLLAAQFACNASYNGCCSSFWKRMEPIFHIKPVDESFLEEELKAIEDLSIQTETQSMGDNILDYISQSKHSQTQDFASRESILDNGLTYPSRTGTLINYFEGNDSLYGRLHSEEEVPDSLSPLYQRVLSALLLEDEFEEYEESRFVRNVALVSNRDDLCTFDRIYASHSRFSNFHLPMQEEIEEGNYQNHTKGSLTGPTNFSKYECEYDKMCMDDKLLLELQYFGLYPETLPDLAEGDDELIDKDIYQLKKKLSQQAGKKKAHLDKIRIAIKGKKDGEEWDLEQLAMNKLIELAYRKLLATRGTIAARTGIPKVSKQVALAFIKRTLARCRKFEVSKKSCFSEPTLRDVLLAVPCDNIRAVSGTKLEPNLRLDSRASGSYIADSEPNDLQNDSYETLSYQSDHASVKNGPILNRGKKKEVLLDDVSNAALRPPSSLTNEAKGKRTEREPRGKVGRPSISNLKGERKNKIKPKQKASQLSTHPVQHSLKREGLISPKNILDSSKESNDVMDLSSLPLSELDSIGDLSVGNEFEGNHDLSSWLNLDEVDGLQDHDSMGLEIPMDDLSELNMLI